ncbi:MAG: amidohydrolase family protein, partial [Terriglobales bacterium]
MFRRTRFATILFVFILALAATHALYAQYSAAPANDTTVLHAAHMLDVERGTLVSPGEVLVRGSRIVEAGSSVAHPSGATVIGLGAATLMPGLIDAHVHLFLHPGA